MWVYFFLGLLGFLSNFWISSLIELLYVPAPPLSAFYKFVGSGGPVNQLYKESVSIVNGEAVFFMQVVVDEIYNTSHVRLYEQTLTAVVEDRAEDWNLLWDISLSGSMYMGTNGFNTTNLALAFNTDEGYSVLNYWPDIRSQDYTSLATKSNLTSMALYNDTMILSFFNDTALFRSLVYSPDQGLTYQSIVQKTSGFDCQEAIGAVLTHSNNSSWVTLVTYVANEAPDSGRRQLEFYLKNNTDWKMYGTYLLPHDLFVSAIQYYILPPKKLKSAPKFAICGQGSEMVIGHYGKLLSLIKWSADNTELSLLDTYSASDFRQVSCSKSAVLLVSGS